uniref:XRN2-binding (XTBD) domain-containing protein n=1 Tax=Caenorhabditis tropicalis TaxID=1561998 RepID=A0A1I7U5Z2_9PELO
MSYQEVSQKIPELWKQQFRNFAIHFAPHSVKNRIYIEQRAFSDGYCREDVRGFVPEGNEAPSERREPVMESKQNCDELAKKVNEKLGLDGEKYGGLMVEKSEDPGRGECTKEVVLDVVRGIIQMVSS